MKSFEFDISKPKDIKSVIKKEFIPFLLQKLPFLENNCFVFLQGSVAREDTIDSSDIDFVIVLPKQIKQDHMDELFDLKAEVEEDNVELHFFLREEMDSVESMWNNDVTLGTLKEAVICYDPHGDGQKLKEKFKEYPPEVLEDKIYSAGQEIIKKRNSIKSFLKRTIN